MRLLSPRDLLLLDGTASAHPALPGAPAEVEAGLAPEQQPAVVSALVPRRRQYVPQRAPAL